MPGVEGGALKSAGERKREWPREGTIFNDGGKIGGSLFWGLTARKKDDAGQFGRDVGF